MLVMKIKHNGNYFYNKITLIYFDNIYIPKFTKNSASFICTPNIVCINLHSRKFNLLQVFFET